MGNIRATISPHFGPRARSPLPQVRMAVGRPTLHRRLTSRFSGFGLAAAWVGSVILLLPSRSAPPLIVNLDLMILLGVNIDHCATLRQARYRQAGATMGGNIEPDPVALAFLCEKAGADGI